MVEQAVRRLVTALKRATQHSQLDRLFACTTVLCTDLSADDIVEQHLYDHEGLTLYETLGFSASLRREMLESASGGRMSTRAFEWRWRATLELGFKSSLFKVESMRT